MARLSILGLLALFTHIHAFWVAGLLLALIDFPDLSGWLGRIATSVEKIAGTKRGEERAEASEQTLAPGVSERDSLPELVPKKPKEAIRASRVASGPVCSRRRWFKCWSRSSCKRCKPRGVWGLSMKSRRAWSAGTPAWPIAVPW